MVSVIVDGASADSALAAAHPSKCKFQARFITTPYINYATAWNFTVTHLELSEIVSYELQEFFSTPPFSRRTRGIHYNKT